MKKKLLAAIFASLLVLGACGGGGDKTNDDGATTGGDTSGDTSGDTASLDVEKIVNNKCIACHGNNLEGGSAPGLTDVGSTHSESEIHDIIINGQGGMPGGLIKGEEADAVAKWLAEKK
ncbi:cytochrome c [Sporosarcina sp. Marseille-Q4063]|uniref:cytochrome c551 n=1 Tax=Sporosarcina sp. Marseille-Q4063 TaxID=2810514 RepID=UPI001BAEDBF7|nr:cytochrome c [Sporosarcina sp. Marseille-Q4063]QUW21645.1 cytochrome c [Sporosarcina sp. Marseille-Q4063]